MPGLRSGASSSAMMTGAPSWATSSDNFKDSGQQSTGLTPFLSYVDPQAIDNAAAQRRPNERQMIEDSNQTNTSRRTSQQSTNYSSNALNKHLSPIGPSVLSPNVVFNFSPGPTGPSTPGVNRDNVNWAPPPGLDGKPQPTERTEGPWRSVETVDTVFQGITNGPAPASKGDAAGLASFEQSADADTDPGFPPVDEMMQQQLLMELFWPGWPPNLPEPHIVNEL